ncbi:hypothetical protein [Leifsonia poae]|uniref:DUF7882 family protein n=1 Tax=Leifsonia poae TaxID=110933 RepID=UPI003D6676A0
MGELHYNGVKISFEDCLLRHLEVVIINKLRRREGFAMNWRNPQPPATVAARSGLTHPSP